MLEQFKLAVVSLEEFSDQEIEKLFLDLDVTSEEDIMGALACIYKHRPVLSKKLIKRIARSRPTS